MVPFKDRVQLSQGYRATTTGQFTFHHYVPTSFLYLSDPPQKHESLSHLGSTQWFEPRSPGLGIQNLKDKAIAP